MSTKYERSRIVEIEEAISLINSMIYVKSSQYPHYKNLLLRLEEELDMIKKEGDRNE